uniref:Uncharacterized protein n=1 Tax=Chromera velia CCMP2878 TaxID=1169474 RepID=A0A0G4GJC8_9ALVE|eukprot:Cvel_22153.t1-p1 / transcript=Cvel_22153.t1 / gene=Cvel_22153 / organism=Chromera_velia_CCMP2878 / gene_product=hypothetical protein / transcript_product=hypothetical protein / location=Cvel_scaffold2149:31988-32713(+) / protein_length=242 / sequence_SO=supercontig / SO=protein_coding / is_pseudo=false
MRGLWVFPLCLLLVCRGQDVIEESSPEAAEPDAITGAPTVENPQGGAGESLPSPASEGEGEKQPFGGRPNPFPNTDGRPGRPPRPFPGGGRPPWWGPPGRPPRGPIARKPVIHLYPTETTEASVTLALPPHSRFISLVPTPQVLERDGEGDEGEEATWRVRAAPDGLMTLQSLPREEAESPPVSSLFWESEMDSDGEGRGRRFVIDREGEEGKAPSVFCVAKPKLGDWLLRALHTVGLSRRD